MSSNEKSLIPYESKRTWMCNLLKNLGLYSENEIITENDNDIKNNGENNIYDDDSSCDNYLVTLDPKDWKNQDHYKVLALSKTRINATENQIKTSYRKIVLRHHPDKQKNVDINCHYYFCITKAYEILSDPIKRRSYDSVDPTFDNTIPNPTTYNKNRFFEIFGPVFERNAIWSLKKNVPMLGDSNSTFDDINNFYNFWYNFESWREYSYLDEEEKEKGENREERRYLDKQNKIVRQKRKKEEMQRIRQLVDNAYQCDPRVVWFKEEEKKRKQDSKLARQAKIQAQKEEEDRLRKEKEEQELAEKKKLEEEEKQKRMEERKQKETLKKKTKKEVKLIENILVNHEYFAGDVKIKIEHMKEFDKLCKIYSLEQIISFRKELESKEKVEDKKEYFISEIEKMNQKLESERKKLTNTSNQETVSSNSNRSSKKIWSYDDVQLIIKAVKQFPPGTAHRWTEIAKYINDKSESGIIRNDREVLEKAKELQQSSESQVLKKETNENAFKKLEIQSNHILDNVGQESAPSQRYDAPSTILEVNDDPWTNEEQQLLEQAMKTYPASLKDERWNLIAECIPKRSRTDCIKRFKYLCDLVRAKNAAKNKAKK